MKKLISLMILIAILSLSIGVLADGVVLYALDGRSQVFDESEVQAQLTVGWYREPMKILYALDGRSQAFPESEVKAQLGVGWYTEPMQLLYAADGRTEYCPKSHVSAQCTVGWDTKPFVKMYALDGRTAYFKECEVENQKTVGWYIEPVTMLYASDGRSQVFSKSQVQAQLSVGWFKTKEEANKVGQTYYASKYAEQILNYTGGNTSYRFTFAYVNGDSIPDAIVVQGNAHVSGVCFFVSTGGGVELVQHYSLYGIFSDFGQFGQAEYIPYGSRIHSYMQYREIFDDYYEINGSWASKISSSEGNYVPTPEYSNLHTATAGKIRQIYKSFING